MMGKAILQGRNEGARILIADTDFDVPNRSPCYLAPEVLVGVDPSMPPMTEETFGPAIGIQRVANDIVGIALMKDSGFGSSLSTHGFLAVTRPKSFHFRNQPD